MNSRYLTNLALAVIGAVVVVVSLAWTPSTFMWIMLGSGIAGMTLAGTAALPRRGLAQRTLDGLIAVLGAWTIVASLVFSGSTVTWLGFASGITFVALAVIGLTLHELSTERVVHSFEVTPGARQYAEIG